MQELQAQRPVPERLNVVKSVFYQHVQQESSQTPQHVQALNLNLQKMQKMQDYSQQASQFCKNVLTSHYEDPLEQQDQIKRLQEEKLREKKKIYQEALKLRAEEMRSKMLLKKQFDQQKIQAEENVERVEEIKLKQKETHKKNSARPKNYLEELKNSRQKR